MVKVVRLNKNELYDVIVLGGGAAGLMCALTAGQRGHSVLVLEVSNKPGKKILMSGGGRCNFTNMEIEAENFICANPHFVKSALNQYTQWDFINLVAKHGVAYHEKTQGQLFCDNSAKDILKLLLNECADGNVDIKLNCSVDQTVVEGETGQFSVTSDSGSFKSKSLVIATGGLSIPTLGGATGYGYDLAKQFDLQVSSTEASLVPLTLSGKWHELAKSLAGVSVPVVASVTQRGFKESLLFTHRGLSGPAILQLSNYWHLGEPIFIDLLPEQSLYEDLLQMKNAQVNRTITSFLSDILPKSLVQALSGLLWSDLIKTPLQEIKNTELAQISQQLHSWRLKPSGTEGYRTAEVTRGGVSVADISSKPWQAENVPGLYLIGEVVDVTGHLGGYNFQWAWSSGYVAGMNV